VWLRRGVFACIFWILLSVLSFTVSAAIQSGKLDGGAASILGAGQFRFASPQTIVVLGTEARPPGTKEPGESMSPRCYAQQASGAAPSRDCPGQGTDTMMLIRAGGGVFRELSIPRDSLAQIPGYPAQKINAAYAFGGAKLAIETVEGFLGIHVDHVVIVDFKGFEDFIDAIGGVTVDVPERICSQISGGAANGGFTLDLSKGQHTLDGVQALTYARTRDNSRDPAYTDINREQAQRAVIAAIKARLTDPLRLPYNFLLGPIIAWDAPRAFVSEMGAFTMPQLVLAAVIGGNTSNGVCQTASSDGVCQTASSGCNLNGPGFEIIVPPSERQRAANWLLHG
jgi:LCP family protein required for cell wall assembly